MLARPLSSLSKILLVACAVGLASSSLYGQDAPSTPSKPAAPNEPGPSRFDIFAGYSYIAPKGTVEVPGANINGTPLPVTYSAINLGAIGSGAYYFDRYVGAQVEYANHPDGLNDGISTAQGGLIARYPTDQGITPFVHFLAGGARVGGPYKEPYTWGTAITAGGGVDYETPFFGHHLAFRLFQADYEYMHVNFGPQNPYPTGGRANINAARLSTGLVYHIGTIVPPPPVMYACSVNPASVFPGDPATVTGTATNLNPKKTAKYTWTATGVKVSGDRYDRCCSWFLYSQGQCYRRREAWPVCRLHSNIGCQALRATDTELRRESHDHQARRFGHRQCPRCKPAEPPTDLQLHQLGWPG
jgi:hypothetical protein